MTDTDAGRALLDELAGRAMDFGTVLDHAAWAEAIDAIERETLAEGIAIGKQQERERIRVRWDTESGDPTKHSAELCHATLNAILAEPSDGPQYVEEVEDRYDR